ncbi:MAG: signal peptidase II [Halanaerobium sp.]|nr:signal peptidase II [Halanaerobium sp.]
MLLFFFLLVLLLDQVSKAWVLSKMALHQSIPIIDGVFHLTLVKNTGAAFGVLPFQRTLFIVVGIIMMIALLIFIYLKRPDRFWQQFALGIGLGGVVGNLVDRIRFGYVVDFLDFQVWPVFNIADSALVISVGLIIILFVLKGE